MLNWSIYFTDKASLLLFIPTCMQVGHKRSSEADTPLLPLRASPVKLDDMRSFSSRLIKEMQFPEQLAESAAEQGIAASLVRLVDEKFEISESDPLLILVVDISDNNFIHYANNGNYGLPGGRGISSLAWRSASCRRGTDACWRGCYYTICAGKVYSCCTKRRGSLKWWIQYIF